MSLSADQSIRKARRFAKAGQTCEAATLYHSVLETYPGNKRAQEGLAALAPHEPSRDVVETLITLSKSGQLDAATEMAASFVRRFPNSVDLHNILGINHSKLGRLEDAVSHFEATLKLKPDFVEAHKSLGEALRRLGRIEEAVAAYKAALRFRPDDAAARNNLGEALNFAGRYEDAAAELQRALETDPDLAPAHNNLGNAFKHLNRHEEAMQCYRHAIDLAPGYAEAHNNLGTTLTDLGQNAEAITEFENAINAKPDFCRALRNLASARTCRPGDPLPGRMAELLSKADLSDDDRAQLYFALGKAHDDLGAYDAAFAHFAEGNRLCKKLLGYSINADKELFWRIKTAFPSPCGEPSRPKDAGPIPIFIVGLPRSGTSLTEQILASHSTVHGAGELDTLENLIAPRGGGFSNAHYSEIGKRYRAKLKKLGAGARFVTDKLPLNFRWIGHIRRALPEAKIIHVERDPCATCWSIFRHYFATKGNGYAYDLDDLAEYYGLYQDLMAHWRDLYGDCIYRLDYERLVENQEAETRALLNHIGVDWEDRCIDFHKTKRPVATASNLQVKKALYSGSSQNWRNYEKFLEPFAEKLSV